MSVSLSLFYVFSLSMASSSLTEWWWRVVEGGMECLELVWWGVKHTEWLLFQTWFIVSHLLASLQHSNQTKVSCMLLSLVLAFRNEF